MKINIRPIQRSDNAILAKIIRSCFHDFKVKCKAGTVYTDPTTDDLYSLFQTPKSQLWVAEADDKIVGCCGIFPTENLPEGCTELVKFYISNEGRGKGIGRLLLEKNHRNRSRIGIFADLFRKYSRVFYRCFHLRKTRFPIPESTTRKYRS